MFWRQLETGRVLAASGDRSVIGTIDTLLSADDRHVRGNAAFVLHRLGDPRGFATIAGMLDDRSTRGQGQGMPGVNWTLAAQIRADRYYAAHLLGDLKDPRGVALLIPLLSDRDAASVVPWSLSQIGDPRAIEPLVKLLERDDPSTRVLTILALETLRAREALPALQGLLQDTRPSNFGELTTVADAARRAIAAISRP
jgi:HEAT repeat protein